MLIEVAGEHPRFLRKQLVQVVDAMMQVRSQLGGRTGSAWFIAARINMCPSLLHAAPPTLA